MSTQELGSMIVRYTADISDLSSKIKSVKSDMSSVSKTATESNANISSSLSKTGKAAEETSKGFKGMASSALSTAIGFGALNLAADGLGFLKDQLGSVFEESMNAQAGMAQTNEVLKSTHDASGMTAQGIADLAGNLSHLTEFSDDTVQSAENMIATFTNIKGNVFPQATKTVLDMSQALGQDTKSSAIQLGKALNDPIAGISALSRVGVTFTQGQKDSIKAMMAHGDIAKAQGVILGELQKEFGGSAEAAGKTFGGQMKILGQRMDDVKQTIGDALMPYLQKLVSWVSSSVVPVLLSFSGWFTQTAIPAIVMMVQKGSEFIDWLQKNSAALAAVKIVGIIVAGALVAAFIAWAIAAGAAAVATIAATWPILAIGAAIALLVVGIIWAVQNWGAIVAWLKNVWGGIAAWFGGIFSAIGTFFHGFWDGIVGFFKGIWDKIVGFAKTFGLTILTVLTGPIGWLVIFIIQHWNQIMDFLKGIWNKIVGFATSFMTNLAVGLYLAWTGIVNKIHSIWDGITGWLKGVWDKIVGFAKSWLTNLEVGLYLAFKGISDKIHGIWNGITGIIKGAINTIIGAINGFIGFIDGIQIHIPSIGVGPFQTPAFNWNGVGIPKIPMLAQGGFVQNTGLAYIHQGETILPAGSGAKTMPLGSSLGSGQTFILEVDGAQLARIVNTSTDRLVRLKLGSAGRSA
jgi:hypothetical protein